MAAPPDPDSVHLVADFAERRQDRHEVRRAGEAAHLPGERLPPLLEDRFAGRRESDRNGVAIGSSIVQNRRNEGRQFWMSSLLDRIGEMLGLKKKPSTTAAAVPAEPMTAPAPSGARPGDENPDAAPPDAEDVEADDPRKDTPTE
jgi:hypothetical protein